MEALFSNRQRRNSILETCILGFAFLVLLSLLIRSFDDNCRENAEKAGEKKVQLLTDSLKKVTTACDSAKMIVEKLKNVPPLLTALDAFVDNYKSKRLLMTPDKQSEWDNELATAEVQFNNLKQKIDNYFTKTPLVKNLYDYFTMYEVWKWAELKKPLLTPHNALDETRIKLEDANQKIQKLENEIRFIRMQPQTFPAPQAFKKTVGFMY